MTNNTDNITQEFIDDYMEFASAVNQCVTWLTIGELEQAVDMIALTCGMAIGMAHRAGITSFALPPLPSQHNTQPKQNNSQTKPWEAIGISRATWYRDQRRARINDIERNEHNKHNKHNNE
jgi:hypothetical protein